MASFIGGAPRRRILVVLFSSRSQHGIPERAPFTMIAAIFRQLPINTPSGCFGPRRACHGRPASRPTVDAHRQRATARDDGEQPPPRFKSLHHRFARRARGPLITRCNAITSVLVPCATKMPQRTSYTRQGHRRCMPRRRKVPSFTYERR